MSLALWPLVAVAGYLLGSLPTAYLVGRLLRGVDVRTLGDGNMGAENAWRTLGPRAGLAVAVVDIGKGAGAVALARALLGGDSAVVLAGTLAVVGHNWPLFLRFRGGRGAATALGVLMAVMPRLVLPLSSLAFFPMAYARSTTLFFGLVFGTLPFLNWAMGAYPLRWALFGVGLALLVGFTHYLTTRHAGEPRPSEV